MHFGYPNVATFLLEHVYNVCGHTKTQSKLKKNASLSQKNVICSASCIQLLVYVKAHF